MNIRDFFITVAALVFIVASFYAFWIIVLLLVGLAIYYAIPTITKLRSTLWK